MKSSGNVSAILAGAKNTKLETYVSALENIPNQHVTDFALYTPINTIQRFLARYELIKMITDIPGAIFEMGVCSGNGLMSLIHCHTILQPTYSYREFVGFDTFDGFPTVHANDIADIEWKPGDFSNDAYDRLHEIIRVHNEYYYMPSKIQLVKGDISKTLPEFLEKNRHMLVALLYLDLDLYEPTKLSLQCVLPRMARGSIIAFDEINYKSFPGETIAMLEELGTQYRFRSLLNSHINYCVLE